MKNVDMLRGNRFAFFSIEHCQKHTVSKVFHLFAKISYLLKLSVRESKDACVILSPQKIYIKRNIGNLTYTRKYYIDCNLMIILWKIR